MPMLAGIPSVLQAASLSVVRGVADAVLRRRKWAVMKEAAARPQPMKRRRAVSRLRALHPRRVAPTTHERRQGTSEYEGIYSICKQEFSNAVELGLAPTARHLLGVGRAPRVAVSAAAGRVPRPLHNGTLPSTQNRVGKPPNNVPVKPEPSSLERRQACSCRSGEISRLRSC